MKIFFPMLAAAALLSGCVIRAERVTITTTPTVTVRASGLPMSLP